MISSESSPKNEAGFALLVVILCLIIMSVLAIGLVMSTRAGLFEAHSDLESSEARAWDDAIILQTADELLNTGSPTRPRIDGVPQLMLIMQQEIPVTVTSEFGKIDLNAANAATLTSLLEAAGQGPAIATETTNEIISWRNNGEAGARPFRTISEVTEVPGISYDLFLTIAPNITVYSGRGGVDESTAPLLALEAGEGMDRLTAESYIQARVNNENSFGEVLRGQLQPGINIVGWAFRIDADFLVGNRREHIASVIRMTGDPNRPYLTLWRDQLPE